MLVLAAWHDIFLWQPARLSFTAVDWLRHLTFAIVMSLKDIKDMRQDLLMSRHNVIWIFLPWNF